MNLPQNPIYELSVECVHQHVIHEQQQLHKIECRYMLMGSGAFIFFSCSYVNAFVLQNSIIKAEFNSSYGDWSKEFVGLHYS